MRAALLLLALASIALASGLHIQWSTSLGPQIRAYVAVYEHGRELRVDYYPDYEIHDLTHNGTHYTFVGARPGPRGRPAIAITTVSMQTGRLAWENNYWGGTETNRTSCRPAARSIRKDSASNSMTIGGMYPDIRERCVGFVMRLVNETTVAWDIHMVPFRNSWVSRVDYINDVIAISGWFDINAILPGCGKLVARGLGLNWFYAELDYRTGECRRAETMDPTSGARLAGK